MGFVNVFLYIISNISVHYICSEAFERQILCWTNTFQMALLWSLSVWPTSKYFQTVLHFAACKIVQNTRNNGNIAFNEIYRLLRNWWQESSYHEGNYRVLGDILIVVTTQLRLASFLLCTCTIVFTSVISYMYTIVMCFGTCGKGSPIA